MTKAEILILDDDEAVRDALAMRLELEDYGVTTFAAPEAFLRDAALSKADCLLLDVRMTGMDGIAVLKSVKKTEPGLPVVIMTGHGDVELAVQALKAGAADFLEKPFADARLREALEKAVKERRAANAAPVSSGAHDRLSTLTPRETDVFHELVAGHPNKIIAHQLGCSQRTVEIHRSRVMSKMEAASLADLVRMAVEGGLMKAST